jgi:hypothetical protein
MEMKWLRTNLKGVFIDRSKIESFEIHDVPGAPYDINDRATGSYTRFSVKMLSGEVHNCPFTCNDMETFTMWFES